MRDSILTRKARRLLAIGLAGALIAAGALLAMTGTNAVGAEEYIEKKVTETVTTWPEKSSATTLTIEGAATRSIERDGTVARFSITVLDTSVRDAVSTGNSALADVRTALQMGCNDDDSEQLCVPNDQLQTTSIRISEQFDWTEQGRVSLGFEYRNSLLARLDGVDQAGLLIDTILIAGGDHVRFDGLDFTASGRAEAERLALLDAIDDAQATADSIAAHMGYEIVRVVELSPVGSLTASRTILESAEEAMADDSFEPTPVFGGSESVTSRVRMVFELRPLAEVEERAADESNGN
ncbi:MAG: SIMPL domain-containing protein [Chloroflexi bacterium]|nr:SIMPL domain-containing protein [Chloroflexota bacterium]MCY3588416.1 SIMPL domain-containing protein [Chloroflexota bacterium]MCY3686867.1 SIMPL domain-containing protein [Chloroflexota bacterium]MDE2709341.1 SIMPL domain-containing protein [Chloroflexota bacterium]